MTDEMSLSVSPPGYLEVGTNLVISCSVRYGALTTIDSSQEPELTLSLDNDQLTGTIYHQAPSDTEELTTKTLVNISGLASRRQRSQIYPPYSICLIDSLFHNLSPCPV